MIQEMTDDRDTHRICRLFMDHVMDYKYDYHFTWMTRPIIQFPQDMVALQEIVMKVKPDLIIETGIAHGGSLILSASLLELLDIYDPVPIKREVLGIDIEIRPHNRTAMENHPLCRKITMIEGNSVDPEILNQVREFAKPHKRVLALLDSCHSEDHVLREMEAYSPLVSPESYMIVYDTIIEFTESRARGDRPWGKGNNPYTAVLRFLPDHREFQADLSIERKYVITACPGGYLKKVTSGN